MEPGTSEEIYGFVECVYYWGLLSFSAILRVPDLIGEQNPANDHKLMGETLVHE